ncbi:MAG TPA: hypothetical protein QF905_05190 [Acidimicrobiales bacterium]|nr:hypothetical protein [Acidimicrobiales bacterium]MDP6214175.1 hypothetical protein [Acidimicrobiales bacterium]HJL89710.1 hypothetical protein [Acidimicrobiales bacterium]
MLDHVFSDAIGSLREALESARLERQTLEERLQTDVLLGDLTWVTSYAMPGEGDPPRVRCDLTLEWPTWSQTSYRNWYLEGEVTEPPEITVEIVLRLQQLASAPTAADVLASLPTKPPFLGDLQLERSGTTVETIYDEVDKPAWALDLTFEGTYELDDATLEDGAAMDDHFAGLGGWIAGALVRLGDLRFDHADTGGPPEKPVT